MDGRLYGSKEIGGGYVRQVFYTVDDDGARIMHRPGTPLSADKIKSFKNHVTMIGNGQISVYPPGNPAETGERHVVHVGRGNFDVIQGVKLNDRPLSKAEAESLATQASN